MAEFVDEFDTHAYERQDEPDPLPYETTFARARAAAAVGYAMDAELAAPRRSS